jgi:hypothetical protein
VAPLETAKDMEWGPWFARCLWDWTSSFVVDAEDLPFNIYGTWNKSCLDDEDLQHDILTHLQTIGIHICAEDVSCYMNRSEVKKKYRMKKGITEWTAGNWLSKLGYQYTIAPTGQYVDGHEHIDVVAYRKDIFFLWWRELEPMLRIWTLDGKSEDTTAGDSDSLPRNRRTVVLFHNESTFCANDRRKKQWC